MKVEINNTEYTTISGIDFSPETDLLCNTLPINQLSVDIRTDDEIDVGRTICLLDESDTLWAEYTIVDVQNVQTGIRRVIGQSAVALLSKVTLPEAICFGSSVTSVLNTIFDGFAAYEWSLDPTYASEEITGYFPEQTARERLQWVVFSIGAYLKTYFNNKIEIVPLGESSETIPESMTYWQPQISYKDYVTRVTIKYYTYELYQGQGADFQPPSSDKWVKVNGLFYRQTFQKNSVINNDVPQYAKPNEVSIDNVTIMNADNVSIGLTRLADYYFNRTQVQASVINNGEFYPGMRVSVCAHGEDWYKGWIQSVKFAFGYQAKGILKLVMSVSEKLVRLTIRAIWGKYVIGKWKYYYRKNSSYEITNPYIDKVLNKHRYVFRPRNATCAGTIGTTSKTVDEPYEVALDYKDFELYVISVDELTEEDGVVRIS